MNLYFEPNEHKYFIQEQPNIKLTSVSNLFDMVKPKFDSDKHAKAYSEKGRDKILQDLSKKWDLTKEETLAKFGHLEFTPEDIKAIWKDKSTTSLARGTAYHKAREDESLLKGAKRGTTIEGNYTKAINLKDLVPGEYIELIIPYLPQFLIGTADKVFILSNKEFIIRDFKTDAKIEYTGTAYYNKYTGDKVVEKLLPPLSHLPNVNGVCYNIKESLYIYFLESYGYKFKEGWIDHVQFNKEGEVTGTTEYPITYMKKEVINLLNWFKTKQK